MIANYHTHTYRCGHAGSAADEEYVRKAIEMGFSILGFSDHCPIVFHNGYEQPEQRMYMEGLDEYISSIRALQKKYQSEIRIYVGLECEFFPEYRDQIEMLKEKVDYLLVGVHWLRSPETGEPSTAFLTKPAEMYEYGDASVKAMETGLFTYLNHPEHGFTNYPSFDKACEAASYQIAEAAKRLGIPLEYNLYGVDKRAKGKFGGLGYPCDQFWRIAAEVGCDAIIGCDAHGPELLAVTDRIRAAEDFLRSLNMRILNTLPGLN